jgi:hypothetical protein
MGRPCPQCPSQADGRHDDLEGVNTGQADEDGAKNR